MQRVERIAFILLTAAIIAVLIVTMLMLLSLSLPQSQPVSGAQLVRLVKGGLI